MIPKEIIIHNTASDREKTTIVDIDAWHKVRWPSFKSSLGHWIGYHFVILGNGQVVQTRRENELGAHTIPNEGKVGIALTGNFDSEKPNPAQLTSLEGLLNRLKKDYNLKDGDIYGHREKSQTSCPGKNLFIWLLLWRQVWTIQKLILAIRELIKGRGK